MTEDRFDVEVSEDGSIHTTFTAGAEPVEEFAPDLVAHSFEVGMVPGGPAGQAPQWMVTLMLTGVGRDGPVALTAVIDTARAHALSSALAVALDRIRSYHFPQPEAD